MNLKSKIIIIIMLSFVHRGFSQNSFSTSMASSLHEKYWFYRERLKYYVQPGDGVGKSIIVDGRNPNRTGDLRVGDQTIDLGFYLAILSMEYNQLGSQSLENDQTLTELYYGLKAFRRLDNCETYAPWFKSEPKEDGFFMRYDVQLKDPDVEFDYEYFNHGLDETQAVLDRYPGLPAYVNVTSAGENTTVDQKLTAMSMDQAAYMIMGLGFVTKCLPDTPIGFNNTVTGEYVSSFNFNQYATDAIDDIGDYISNPFLDEGASFPVEEMEDYNYWFQDVYNLVRPGSSVFTDEDMLGFWAIFDPNEELVKRGPWPFLIRWGYHSAVNKLTGHSLPTSFPTFWIPDNGVETWKLYGAFAPSSQFYNRTFSSVLAAIGNSWNYLPLLQETDSRIFNLLDDENQQYLYLLMYIFFQGENTYYVNDGTGTFPWDYSGEYNSEVNIHDFLSTAPWCGPYNYPDANGTGELHFNFCDCNLPRKASDGWASQNRFRNYINEQNGITSNQLKANFPGLDYMLLYNLFHYYLNWWYGSPYGSMPYRNMMNSVIVQNYPYVENGSYKGTTSDPANLRAFNSFNYNGTISQNNGNVGELNLIAGEKIKLTPGFHVYQGGTFSAKIEEFDCFARSQNSKSDNFIDNNYVQYSWEELPVNSLFNAPENDIKKMENSNLVEKEGAIIIVPNPALHQIQVQANDIEIASFLLTIVDIYGNTVLVKPNYESGSFLDISELKSGFYIAEAVIGSQVYVEKFTVL